MATLGYVRSSNGPDLAQVGVNEQIVSHTFPNITGETLRITHVSAWVGNWGGTAMMRFGIWAASSSSAAPGALLARTVEFSPTVNYMDGGGGQLRTVALETPYDLAPGQVICLGAASRNNSAGIAMYQASAISQPNESFYRKGISGTNLQSAAGSSVSNEGHLAIYVTGTTNVAPLAPDDLGPVGDVVGTIWPTMYFRHRDPDGNAASWATIEVQTADGSETKWFQEFSVSGVGNNNYVHRVYGGSALLFHEQYRFRARTRDIHGVQGPNSDWVYFTPRHTNRRPNRPSSPTGLGDIEGSLNITVGFGFSDPDYPLLSNGQAWERFDAKQRIVYRDADNTLVSNSGVVATTTAERNASRSSWAFTLPAYDVLYRWEERHFDRSGASSAYAVGYVRALSGAGVDAPTNPTGLILDPDDPGNIRARYVNSALLSADQAWVRLLNAYESPIDQAGGYAVSVPAGGHINIAWGSTGFELEPGRSYATEVSARATNGQISGWSEKTWFKVNSGPTVPMPLSPNDGLTTPTLPDLSVRVTHPDSLPFTVDIQIHRYNGSSWVNVGSYAASRVGATSEYKVTAAQYQGQISGYGEFRFIAIAYDGYLYSGGSRTTASGWSQPRYFTYAAVPTVTITAPSSPITTSQPEFNWTSSEQTQWRLRLWDHQESPPKMVYDTGVQPGSATSHVINPAYWLGGARWRNHQWMGAEVAARSSAGLWGWSPAHTVQLSYIPPNPVVIDSETSGAVSFPGIAGTHYVQISHSQSDELEDDFLYYAWTRVEIDSPGGAEMPGTLIPDNRFYRSGGSSETMLRDFNVRSNQWYRWGVRVVAQAGVDIIESEPVFYEAMVSWHGTLIHSNASPLDAHVWLQYGAPGGRFEPHVIERNIRRNARVMGRSKPRAFVSGQREINPNGEYTFLSTEGKSAMQQLDELYRVNDWQHPDIAPNGRPNGICWRAGRGGSRGLLYVTLNDIDENPFTPHTHVVSLEFEEYDYDPFAEVE